MSIIQEIEESWGWVGIVPIEVVGENDFGNLIIKDSYDSYWSMCPEDFYCKRVANNREELDVLFINQEFLEDWYMRLLVKQANEYLGSLSNGRKYCLIIPSVFGGEYAISNVTTQSVKK